MSTKIQIILRSVLVASIKTEKILNDSGLNISKIVYNEP